MHSASSTNKDLERAATAILAVAFIIFITVVCSYILSFLDPSYAEMPVNNIAAVLLIIGFLAPIILCLIPALLVACAVMAFYDWLTEQPDNNEEDSSDSRSRGLNHHLGSHGWTKKIRGA